jgi:hypothetical protein
MMFKLLDSKKGIVLIHGNSSSAVTQKLQPNSVPLPYYQVMKLVMN